MSRSKEYFAEVLLVVLLIYVSGYVVYRQYGSVGVHYPRDGGVQVMLVSNDTRASAALARLFEPCIKIESYCLVRFGRRN